MRTTIIILVFLIRFTGNVIAQDQFAADLLRLEEKVYTADTDSLRAFYLLEKFSFYIRNNRPDSSAFREARRIKSDLLPDTLRADFLWNASLVAQLNGNHRSAIFYLNEYKKVSGDTSVNVLILEAIASANLDTSRLRSIINKDTSLGCLACLASLSATANDNKKLYTTMSAIVPGSGTIALGKPLKGLVSMGIATGIVFFNMYCIRNGLYINAAGWTSTWGVKFYTGNLRLTQAEYARKQALKKQKPAENCELLLKELLEKYPVDFR